MAMTDHRPYPPLTIAVINYNGRDVLPSTLDALRQVEYGPLDRILVDDGSTDGSVEWTAQNYPEIRIVLMERNMQKPSWPRNRALADSATDFVLLIDNDIALAPDCPAKLMDVMTGDPEILCCSPRLVYAQNEAMLYYDGGSLHYLCISGPSVRGQPVAARPERRPFPTVAGGNLLLNRKLARKLGFFDTGFAFGWGEDAELCLRGRLSGMHCLHVPAAVARHVERPRGLQRAEAQLYNRYRTILTMYAPWTLLVLGPALGAFELGLLLAGAATGVTRHQTRALRRIWETRHELRRRRLEIQRRRRVSDRDILTGDGFSLPGVVTQSRFVRHVTRIVGLLFRTYWEAVRTFL